MAVGVLVHNQRHGLTLKNGSVLISLICIFENYCGCMNLRREEKRDGETRCLLVAMVHGCIDFVHNTCSTRAKEDGLYHSVSDWFGFSVDGSQRQQCQCSSTVSRQQSEAVHIGKPIKHALILICPMIGYYSNSL